MSAAFGGEPPPLEARAALALQLRRASVRDVAVMNAFERVPRELFAPHRFRDLANRNMALPIGCGQTMPAPADLAGASICWARGRNTARWKSARAPATARRFCRVWPRR